MGNTPSGKLWIIAVALILGLAEAPAASGATWSDEPDRSNLQSALGPGVLPLVVQYSPAPASPSRSGISSGLPEGTQGQARGEAVVGPPLQSRAVPVEAGRAGWGYYKPGQAALSPQTAFPDRSFTTGGRTGGEVMVTPAPPLSPAPGERSLASTSGLSEETVLLPPSASAGEMVCQDMSHMPAGGGPADAQVRHSQILQLPSGPVTLTADQIHGNWGRGIQVTAQGKVVVTRGDATIQADTVSMDLATQKLAAAGNIRFQNPLGMLTADSLEYNLKTSASSGKKLEAMIEGFSLRASRFVVEPAADAGSPPTMIAYDGAITSCTFDHPDYLLSARKIQLQPNHSLKASHVGISLFGVHLATARTLTFNLAPSRQQARRTVLPRLGYSIVRGPFLGWNSALHLGPGSSGQTTLVLSRRLGVSGGLTLNQVAGAPVEVSLLHREEIPKFRFPRLTVDKLPEVRYPVGTLQKVGTGSLLVVGEAVGGYYREADTHVNTGRVVGRGSLSWLSNPTVTHAVLGIGLSDALYPGSSYLIAGAQAGYQVQFASELSGSAVFHINRSTGRTPFVFDRLEAPTRLDLSLESDSTGWGWNINTAYDLSGRHLYDTTVGISHTIKCLRPSIAYHFRNREIDIGLTIPALEGLRARLHPQHGTPPPRPENYFWNEGDAFPIQR